MKHLLLLPAIIVLAVFSATAQPIIKFQEKVLKFERVRAGEVLNFEYVFENKGDQPLIITDIKVSCDCTKSEWPEAPVKPGEKAKINVSFDTSDKIGFQDRALEITSNSKSSPDNIRFKGMIDNPDWKKP